MSLTARMLFASASLGALALASCATQPAPPKRTATPLTVEIPRGLEPVDVPFDNEMTVEKVALGKQLYFDKRLSLNDTISCATCHDPERGWTDQAPVSSGIGGQTGTRSAPTILNAAYGISQFWDGRAATLEDQALGPIQNPIEMGESLEHVVRKLNDIPGYRSQFQNVFGTDVTSEGIAKAIAAFERTVLTGDSPWDRFQGGDAEALTEEQKRGWEIFNGKGNCGSCHVGFNLTDGIFHNIGVGLHGEGDAEPDYGRYVVTKVEMDKGAFKTPVLRNLSRTAPYMHDGSEATLEAVVEYYNKGGFPNEWLDPKITPLKLTDQEKADLVAFMLALDGTSPKAAPPELP